VSPIGARPGQRFCHPAERTGYHFELPYRRQPPVTSPRLTAPAPTPRSRERPHRSTAPNDSDPRRSHRAERHVGIVQLSQNMNAERQLEPDPNAPVRNRAGRRPGMTRCARMDDAADGIQLLQFDQPRVDGLPNRRVTAELALWKVHVDGDHPARWRAWRPTLVHQSDGTVPDAQRQRVNYQAPNAASRKASRKTITLLPWWWLTPLAHRRGSGRPAGSPFRESICRSAEGRAR
jgi:hypothetical protein